MTKIHSYYIGVQSTRTETTHLFNKVDIAKQLLKTVSAYSWECFATSGCPPQYKHNSWTLSQCRCTGSLQDTATDTVSQCFVNPSRFF